MSVIMALRLKGDAKRFEQYCQEHPEMAEIADDAVERGAIAHRFFGSADGSEVIVVDEWPDAESFQQFFAANEGRVGALMGGAGVEPAGDPEFWTVLDTPDKRGWDGTV